MFQLCFNYSLLDYFHLLFSPFVVAYSTKNDLLFHLNVIVVLITSAYFIKSFIFSFLFSHSKTKTTSAPLV